jgi:hypothetical protein
MFVLFVYYFIILDRSPLRSEVTCKISVSWKRFGGDKKASKMNQKKKNSTKLLREGYIFRLFRQKPSSGELQISFVEQETHEKDLIHTIFFN